MKYCQKCSLEKVNEDFGKNPLCKDGLQSFCRVCTALYYKQWAASNKAKIKVNQRKWLNKNPQYRPTVNRETANKCSNEWKRKNQDKVKAVKKRWIAANRDQERKRALAWSKANRDKINTRKRLRFKENPSCKIAHALRGSISTAIRKQGGVRKGAQSISLLGCSITFFTDYIAARFLPGMTWENKGEWHLDHRIPCASFDLTIVENQFKCFHYSNLQPLWAIDNFRKSNKIPSNHQAEFI